MRDSPVLMLTRTDRGTWRATSNGADAEHLVRYVQHITRKEIPWMIDDRNTMLRVNTSTVGLYMCNDTPPRGERRNG